MMSQGRTVNVVVTGAPAPAGSKVIGKTKAGRRFVRDDSGNAGRDWKKALRAQVLEQYAGGPLTGALAVTLRFYLERGVSVTRRYPTVRPDVLKLARAVEDGLSGVLWADDAQIVSEHLGKAYGAPARVEISVSEVE